MSAQPKEQSPEVTVDRAQQRLKAWRFGSLASAGYDADAAERIAERFDIDLHQACLIRARGCPNELALRILL